ncbi:MAG: hypothetical protein K0Q65_1249 [Clostridia bacterium]|nr:hypothetical protein [Clostridia bacterium]
MNNKIIGKWGVLMNIKIEKDAADYIKKHSKEHSVILFIKSGSGG